VNASPTLHERQLARGARPRLAIVATHPTQYYAPLFELLAARAHVELHVFYGWPGLSRAPALDPGFGRTLSWDVPLLENYQHTLVANSSRDPGTHHFRGIASPELIPALRRWRPDAVLIYGWSYQSHLTAIHTLRGRVPILFRGDSTLLDETPGLRRWARRAALSWIYRHVDLALYVGARNREYFVAHGLRDSRLAWAPHAVDNERFADASGAAAREAAAWRDRLGIGADSRAALFAGKLEYKKAPDLLLRSFLDRARADEHLIIVGTGPMESALADLGRARRNVHFLGFQNQTTMPVVYRLGDVFVLPSRGPGETWGLAVNEAMACGRPVIVSDRVGCAPDLVVEGGTGAVVPHDDGRALGEALARAFRDASEWQAHGQRARHLIQGWSLSEAAARIEASVDRVLCAPRAN